MSNADSKRYDLYFAGECLEGHATDAVRAAVGNLFKADGKTLDRLFSGQRQRIKRDCDEATALRYQKAMKAAGARVIVTPAESTTGGESPTTPGGSAPPSSPQEAPRSAPEEPAGLSLAPAGSDVLRPDERVVTEAVAVDLGHLSVAETGEDLGAAQAPATPGVDAPDFEIAAVGTDLDPNPRVDVAAVTDTSGIDLAPADYDLSDCRPPEPEAPDLDLDRLSLSDPGADLLNDDERQHSDATPPDTSHLGIDIAGDS